MKKRISEKKEVSDKNRLKKETEIAGTLPKCRDRKCPRHGSLKVRGRVFEGRVTRKFESRVTIELERMVYSRKYERYYRRKTKIHAHLPACMENEIQLGDLIRIQECRPLSKIIHFTVIKKLKAKEER
jgi:small subunit ribosomal protein S17